MYLAKPSTSGVISVMDRAMRSGFSYGNREWVNFGQGAPETGPIPGGSFRLQTIPIDPLSSGYAPVHGLLELRQKIANLYNFLYRHDSSSQYTADNVCVSGGGRIGIARIFASLSDIKLGYFLPDYASYEQLLHVFHSFEPVAIPLSEEEQFHIPIEDLYDHILNFQLEGILISNPCNPTGQHMRDDELKSWVKMSRELRCLSIFDEFYSHYVFGESRDSKYGSVSAAQYIQDIDQDPVFIVDGLTKNWRYPGLRLSWTLGPKEAIAAVQSAGSFLDGGAPHPIQRAVLPLLEPAFVLQESAALRKHYERKKDYVLERVRRMGMTVAAEPQGSFYCWVDLSHLPSPINTGEGLFKEALKEKIIIVPGEFFDLDPGQRRRSRNFRNFMRLSFGPPLAELRRGFDALERVVKKCVDHAVLAL